MDPGDSSHLQSQRKCTEMITVEPSPAPVLSAGNQCFSLVGRTSPHGPVTPSPDGRVHSHRPGAEPLGSPEPGLLASTFCTYLTLCFLEKISLGSLLFQPHIATTQFAACPSWRMCVRACVFVCVCVCLSIVCVYLVCVMRVCLSCSEGGNMCVCPVCHACVRVCI